MTLKYALFATIFFATTPLLSADVMDGAVAQQQVIREWTREEKLAVFRDVQGRLSLLRTLQLQLNEQQIIDNRDLSLQIKLRHCQPRIRNQILKEICNFKWLKKVDLSQNERIVLPPEIAGLTQLKELVLNNNVLAIELPLEIRALTQLTNLRLSCSQLMELPSQIESLTQLTKLNLMANSLREIPPQIGALTQLTGLSLGYNRLTGLPPQIGALTQLASLSLGNNRLTGLPPQIGALTQLTSLSLGNNRLTEIPQEIGTLTQLEELYLNDNKLTHLPSQIRGLTQLQRLNLHDNRLTALPPEIGTLTQLETLCLDDNQLTELPPQIGALTQLTELGLDHNRLMILPASIQNIQTLTLFDLRGNPLLPTGETPEEWGRQELEQHFRDRVFISRLSLENMPDTTTESQVYAALDTKALRMNRENFTALRLPDIHVDKVFLVDEMLEALNQIIGTLNLTDEQGEAYLSYEILANDFASDAHNTPTPLTNVEKIKAYLMPRLTGYIRGLYGVPLAPTDIRPWTMYAAQIPETQKALTYLLEKIRDAGDVDRQALLFYQLVNGLLHCPTGQAEGINAVAYALAEGEYRVDDFVGNLKHHLAVRKNTAFTQSILTKGAESTQNTHLISFYRDLLKEKLGLTAAIASFTERLGTCGADPFGRNQWNVVKVFYDVVTPHRLVGWAMGLCEARTPAISTASTSTPSTAPAQRSSSLNTGLICGYLSDQKLIGDGDEDGDDNWWQAYFTADPTLDESARITRDGMLSILVHMGPVIRD